MHNLFLSFFLLIQALIPCFQDYEIHKPSATNKVFRSLDGGQTWQDISDGLPEKFAPGCIYVDNTEVLLGSDIGIYRSRTNTGSPNWIKDVYQGNGISDIFPGKAGRYARTYEDGFLQEVMNSGVWIPKYKEFNGYWVRSISETQDGTIFITTDKGVYKSTDQGKNWKMIHADEQVMSLVEADGVMIGAAFKGLLRSTDKGEHWNYVLTDSGSIRKLGIINGHFYAITNGVGEWNKIMSDTDGMANSLLISKDKGLTWQNMDKSLTAGRFVYDLTKRPPVQFINDVEQLGEYLFCSLDSGIYRSSNQGKSWVLVFSSKDKKMFNFAVSGKVIYAIYGSILGGC